MMDEFNKIYNPVYIIVDANLIIVSNKMWCVKRTQINYSNYTLKSVLC